jgi:hypothetical protein
MAAIAPCLYFCCGESGGFCVARSIRIQSSRCSRAAAFHTRLLHIPAQSLQETFPAHIPTPPQFLPYLLPFPPRGLRPSTPAPVLPDTPGSQSGLPAPTKRCPSPAPGKTRPVFARPVPHTTRTCSSDTLSTVACQSQSVPPAPD